MLFTFLLVPIFLFFFGAAVGSFLNVIIYRSETGESWAKGRSHCESCKTLIAWYDNIPLLSFFILQGKCRKCKAPLSISHPVVEGLTGALFVWWYFAGFLFFKLTQQPFVVLQPLFWLVVGMILLMIVVIDLKQMVIPDTAVALLFVVVILYRIWLVSFHIMKPEDLLLSLSSMAGAGLLFLALFLITRGRGIGFGDVKLALPLGLLLGWPQVLVWIFSSFCIGGVVGIVLLSLKKVKLKTAVPFGPFLVVGTLIALIWGDQLFGWYVTLIK
ncbi:MAG: prepilin peptidase [Candidatus Pacebacteria bacterium CG_4_10_14_0_8_um_filter_43_12]|nr:MAG: prepilin peptidase [Candidatus Pacebacteria bacterium CG_4_10_14_0_8_um_filter_43_12]